MRLQQSVCMQANSLSRHYRVLGVAVLILIVREVLAKGQKERFWATTFPAYSNTASFRCKPDTRVTRIYYVSDSMGIH